MGDEEAEEEEKNRSDAELIGACVDWIDLEDQTKLEKSEVYLFAEWNEFDFEWLTQQTND